MTGFIEQHIDRLKVLCRKHSVVQLEVFGSAAGGKQFDPVASDIDFLVKFTQLSASDHAKAYFGLLADLQDLFKTSIDLVEITAVTNPYFLESLNKTRTEIYAA